ncbi:MAG: hypothetical protein HY305_07400 [Sphingobacteriales bacterium]|nr:hypothetical protein [Sphingobacteriales bacterium]
MKKIIFIFLLLITGKNLKAQFALQSFVPTAGFVQKSQLWNIVLINSNSNNVTYYGNIELTLRDVTTGQELYSAATGIIEVPKGAKQINATIPFSVLVNNLPIGTQNNNQELLPIGSYTVCYSFVSGREDPISIADECTSFEVEPLSPPMLILPSDSTVLDNAPAQFSWIPPTPSNMFGKLQYEIVIAEVKDGQNPNEAIQLTLPFYSDYNLYNNFLNYPSSAITFDKDKWYAWQIIARDDKAYGAKSEVWVFKVKANNAAKDILAQMPYIKMKSTAPDKGIAANGILKLSYVNETRDSIAIIEIVDINQPDNKNTLRFKVKIKPGENLIEYNLLKHASLEKGKTYQAQIVNSRDEKWAVQFEVYNYK